MSEPSAQLTLSVGDRVVYPNQGVCRVSAIEVKEVAGQKLSFVTMRREEDGAVVMVPEAKIKTIGVRRVAGREEVDQIFSFLRSDSDKADLDWKQRARTNLERMTQGGVLGLAEVVKGLQVLSELRPLPTKERELYDNARHLLVSEVSAGLGVSEVDAEDAIDIILFPPGKERPKRTVSEFKPDDEGLEDLDPDLLNMGGDLDLPSDEEPDAEATEVSGKSDEEEEGAEETTEDGVDDEVTQPSGASARKGKAKPAAEAEPAKRKRGRPPKPKPAVDPNVPPPAPKKRGRPPKPKPPVDPNTPPPAPKKRGRPPKNKDGAKK